MIYKSLIKRSLDAIVAWVVLLLTLPILVFTAFLLTLNNKGSAFFFQKRPGKKGRIFSIIKFKTMTDAKDSNGELLPDNKRLTKLGAFVRKTSLDELPQLINVLKGDMSIVGPRPLLPEYLPLYNEEQAKRHNVLPGITGWAQVNGRNAISWEQKFTLDVFYVKNISFKLDVQILIKTVLKVLKSADINTEGQATTIKFTGTK